MSERRSFLRKSGASSAKKDSVDPDSVLEGTDSKQGVITICDQLRTWKETYTNDYNDYLTLKESLEKYQVVTQARQRLKPLSYHKNAYDDTIAETVSTIDDELQDIITFIEQRDEYNEQWVNRMKDTHGADLNSYFDDPDHSHTDEQFQAIFANDNFNRVNAAAGTGKTTTFGRRVQFILSEYDDVAADDLLAFTFTKNGRDEMKKELAETFDITGVDVRTINSYARLVAMDEYSDLELITGGAKTTEIASIWREIVADPALEDTYDAFLTAWKDDQYDPDDIEIVNGVVDALASKSEVTILGEKHDKEAPAEARIARQTIARYLTAHQIEYDFKKYLDWASSPSGGYTIDFVLLDDVDGERIHIHYCISEGTRTNQSRNGFRSGERPETIRRVFSNNLAQDYDPSGNSVIVLAGDELLQNSSEYHNWDDNRFVETFETTVEEAIDQQLSELGVSTSPRFTGQEFNDYVYDRKILYHDIIDEVSTFIDQARVREWEPTEAKQKAAKFIHEAGSDLDPGVREFVNLCNVAYEEFCTVFDNRTKTDFNGSVVLTRDLLKQGKVDDEYLYLYVFVDEMQDLNQLQFSLVKYLTQQLPDVRMFGVGDDWQSIFGFQGARPDLFINFGPELGAGDSTNVDFDPTDVLGEDQSLDKTFTDTRLEDNYRCPDTVVAASNVVIKNNEVRTNKNPTGNLGGEPIVVHHLGCDTFGNKLNRSLIRYIKSLIQRSEYDPCEIQVLLRQTKGDPAFFYQLKREIPEEITIRTAHNAKGSEAEHVIIPKVVKTRGYPSIRPNKWVEPIKQPPEVYSEHDVSYQLEEERRLFYVALTRAKSQLDILTVQGAESVFIDELPDALCTHERPLSSAELTAIDEDHEIRRPVTGRVDALPNQNFATFDWSDGEYVSLNLYDATEEQQQTLTQLAGNDRQITLENCRIRCPSKETDNGDEYSRIQLKIDKDVIINQ